MMWREFEQIAGYEVTYEDYHDLIEPMYMAVGDTVNKYEFVKMIDKNRFAIPSPDKYLREVRKEARYLKAICGFSSDIASEQRMEKAAHDYAKRKYGLDWSNDTSVFVYFLKEYEFPELKRGCTYPVTMVIGQGRTEYARVKLQRN